MYRIYLYFSEYKCRKNTENVDPKVLKTKNIRTMLSSKFAVYNTKKPRVMKEQEASGLLSSLGIRIPLIKIPLSGKILF